MAQYEMMMIVDPAIWEDAQNASIDGVKKALKNIGAKIENEDVWGERKLAYKIHGSEKGYYLLLTMELDGTQIPKLNAQFNLDGSIWRYMFINLDA